MKGRGVWLGREAMERCRFSPQPAATPRPTTGPQGSGGEAGSDRWAKQVEERQAQVAGGGRPFLSFSPWLLSLSWRWRPSGQRTCISALSPASCAPRHGPHMQLWPWGLSSPYLCPSYLIGCLAHNRGSVNAWTWTTTRRNYYKYVGRYITA